ncbi:MAG: lipopolysaccharide biosynthesis protein [Clostridium butyricum]|jgi:O-antigen/teichoic acid export membrane protein|nr:lipopolysaccharide biosynthesis protein [Clostridium butyricum]
MKQNKENVLSNLIWRFAERCGAQIVQFLVSIVLARILAPEDYGIISLVVVFTQIFEVFVDSGLGNALIQKKDADDLDFSSVFWFNLALCLCLYSLLFISAPMISSFYNSNLTSIVRVLCITIVISGLKNVQQAYVSKTLQFKKFFFSTLGGTLVSAVFGIGIAMLGGGVWALVVQKLTNIAIDTIVLWLIVEWRPKMMFSFQRLKGLISYGWKLLVSSLLDNIYNNLNSLIIGKMYSSTDLAYYNQGRQFPNVIVTNINTSIDSVLLPTMSKVQDDPQQVKRMTRRSIKISTYVMAPLMMGIAFCAEPLVRLMLTEKWLPCVPYMRIFCITYMFYPIHTANLNAIKAMGRSDLFLLLEISKKVVGLVLLFSTMWFGVMAMAYSLLIISVTSQIINSWPNRKLLNYSYIEQLKDILPSIILSVIMGVCIYIISLLRLHNNVTLLIQLFLGVGIYIGGSALFKFESLQYLLGIILPYIKKINHNS